MDRAGCSRRAAAYFVPPTGCIEFFSELFSHLDKTARQILLLHRFLVLFLHFLGGFLAGSLDARDLLEANGQSACADRCVAMQWHQQGRWQEAQAKQQVDMKGGRHRIALIERLWNGAPGLAQTGVIEGHCHQT